MTTKTLDPEAKKNALLWLNEPYDENTKSWIKQNLDSNPDLINAAFYRDLEFGTGGLRGIMGIGSNRMNVYTIRRATQGLANYLLKTTKSPSVMVGYDGRENSRLFAEEVAKVLAASEITCYLFKELRPTPLVSFGVRYKKATAGIMITASHNPPEYNGYKVYWNDGGQVLPPNDIGIIEEVYKLKHLDEIKVGALDSPFVKPVLEEIDQAYIKALLPLKVLKGPVPVKALYTSLHGTGITLMPTLLKAWEVEGIAYVEKQCVPDGKFTYAKTPNPEEKAALEMGIEQMLREKHDLLLATDPDADRVGVAVIHKGQAALLNGNQIACICLDFLIRELKKQGRLPAKASFIKTIVTTELFKKIASQEGYYSFDVLTGFKYVAEKIREWEVSQEHEFVFGGEESYGYLYGTQTRDKDGLIISALLCEIAGLAKKAGKTLIDVIEDIYRKYGLYLEKLASFKFPETKEGRESITTSMQNLRQNPPKTLNGQPIVRVDDYMKLESADLVSGRKEKLLLEQSDVLVYWMKNGAKVMIRPSGTEPKVKVYCGVNLSTFDSIQEGTNRLTLEANNLISDLEKIAFKQN